MVAVTTPSTGAGGLAPWMPPPSYSPSRALKLARLSEAAYSPHGADLAQSDLGYHYATMIRAGTCHALVAWDDEGVSVAFRGTEPTVLQDLLADAEAALVLGPYGRVHEGFRRFYTAIRADLFMCLPRGGDRMWLTGHSLGGSLALLAGVMDFPSAEIYAFAPARTGDATFAGLFDPTSTWSFVREADPVPRLAPIHWGYADIATRLYLRGGAIHTQDTTTIASRIRLDARNLIHARGLFADHGIASYRADLEKLVTSQASDSTALGEAAGM